MQNPLRCFTQALTWLAACASLASFDAPAQGYPVKPIHMLRSEKEI